MATCEEQLNATRRPDSMCASVRGVLFDLDGTLLDSERLVDEVCSRVLAELTGDVSPYSPAVAALGRGRRPLEACELVCETLALALTPAALLALTDAALTSRWSEVALLPGALRLLQQCRSSSVKLALVTSTPRQTLLLKTAGHPTLLSIFDAIVTGDDVSRGKPAPDAYQQAAALLDLQPHDCLAVEDALSGVESARAAGCQVLAVPSLADRSAYAGPRTVVLNSLLDVQPERWGLPPFSDFVAGALPLSPMRLRGPVVRGFGRGSKLLGIPTANLDVEALGPAFSHAATTGIYAAFATIAPFSDTAPVFKAVLSIGTNPFFKDVQKKTVEPWLLADFPDPFYGAELRLVVVAYLRAEADFVSLEQLVLQIRADGELARYLLDHEPYAALAHDAFLREQEMS